MTVIEFSERGRFARLLAADLAFASAFLLPAHTFDIDGGWRVFVPAAGMALYGAGLLRVRPRPDRRTRDCRVLVVVMAVRFGMYDGAILAGAAGRVVSAALLGMAAFYLQIPFAIGTLLFLPESRRAGLLLIGEGVISASCVSFFLMLGHVA